MRALPIGLTLVLSGCAFPAYSVDEELDLPALAPVPSPEDCAGVGGVVMVEAMELEVSEMVPVPGGYCIDRTEVTWWQYWAWLGATALPEFQTEPPTGCDQYLDLNPSCSMPAGVPDTELPDDLPVTCVTWCQAYVYCASVGKELCGAIDHPEAGSRPAGGVHNPYASFDDASRSQWHNACTSGARYDYPYGTSYVPSSCNTEGGDARSIVAPGARDGCHAPFPSSGGEPEYGIIYDLSGNVAEWENSCESGNCRVRGGSPFLVGSQTAPLVARCDHNQYLSRQRQSSTDYVGFRCCHTPPQP